MISEIEFIREHTSFWRTISPLSEDFVRQINVKVLNRFQRPLKSNVSTSRRALINEIGFEIFSHCISENLSPNAITIKELGDIVNQVCSNIATLRNKAPHFKQEMQDLEVKESKDIAQRLLDFFRDSKDMVIKPKFSGLGKLNTCEGDVFADGTLYEVKAGGRPFRSLDLRQLILYLTLNRFSGQYDIQNLGLYNPRQGFHFLIPHNEFSMHFSGLSSEELCHRVSYELTIADLDRFGSYD